MLLLIIIRITSASRTNESYHQTYSLRHIRYKINRIYLHQHTNISQNEYMKLTHNMPIQAQVLSQFKKDISTLNMNYPKKKKFFYTWRNIYVYSKRWSLHLSTQMRFFSLSSFLFYMTILSKYSVKAHRMESPWNDDRLYNGLRFIGSYLVARISRTRDLVMLQSLSAEKGIGVAVLLQKGLDLGMCTLFLSRYSKSVVMDVINCIGYTFGLVAVSVLTGAVESNLSKHLVLQQAYCTSVLMSDCNGILETVCAT